MQGYNNEHGLHHLNLMLCPSMYSIKSRAAQISWNFQLMSENDVEEEKKKRRENEMINRYVKYVSLFSFTFVWVDWVVGTVSRPCWRICTTYTYHYYLSTRCGMCCWHHCQSADLTKSTQYAGVRMFQIQISILQSTATATHTHTHIGNNLRAIQFSSLALARISNLA